MDRSDPDLRLDVDGVCNWCHRYDNFQRQLWLKGSPQTQLERRIEEIRKRGKGKRYDCVVGISGGLDSSYALYTTVKKFGLRPLAVHVDNGWNSERAVHNIEQIVNRLGVDLYTHVIDWNEFKLVQRALLKASVVDLELASDHAIIAGMYHAARKHSVQFILSGDDASTESPLPRTWNHRKTDLRNLKHIVKVHGGTSLSQLSTFPRLGTLGLMLWPRIYGMRWLDLLTFVDYDKQRATEILVNELDWRPYGGKHHESIITRFYQGYILPNKFGIDKRRLHYSLLINAKQMTRSQAIVDLRRPPYDPELMKSDRLFFIKKLGLTNEEFEAWISVAPQSHYNYKSDEKLLKIVRKISSFVSRFSFVAREPSAG